MSSASELRSECLDRIRDWEQATTLRREREAAEAFTRAFAELDACLSDGTSVLPPEWEPDPPPDPGRWDRPGMDGVPEKPWGRGQDPEQPQGWRNPEARNWP